MNWNTITNKKQVDSAVQRSFEKPVLFFKHSTRCGASAYAQRQLNESWDLREEEITPYFLDLLAHRDVSNYIADKLSVIHQSPQVIMVREGKVIYAVSHHAISVDKIRKQLAETVQ